MAAFSMGDAWDATHRFVRQEAALLVPVALALIAVPGMLVEIATPARTPDPMEPGSWMLLLPLYGACTVLASLVIARLALGQRTSVGEALREGIRRLPRALLASFLLAFACAVALVPVLPLLGRAGGVRPGAALFLSVYMLAALVALIYLTVRLMMLHVVIVAEGRSATASIRRAWELTRGRFWQLLVFLLLFVVVTAVAGLAVSAAGSVVFLGLGRLAGQPDAGELLFAAATGTVNALFSLYLVVMLAYLYRQVAGSSSGT